MTRLKNISPRPNMNPINHDPLPLFINHGRRNMGAAHCLMLLYNSHYLYRMFIPVGHKYTVCDQRLSVTRNNGF